MQPINSLLHWLQSRISNRPFLFPFIIITLITSLIYFPSFDYGYTYYDDNLLVKNRLRYIQSASLSDIFSHHAFHPTQDRAVIYRPLLTLSLKLNTLIGTQPPAFHLGNLTLHIAALSFLYLLLKKLTKKPIISLLSTLVVSLHPLLVHAVAWIPGRNDSLLAIWVIISVYFFHRWLQRKNLLNLTIHFIAFVLALLTKESAVLLPILLIFYQWLVNSNKQTPSLTLIFLGWTSSILGWWLIRASIVQQISFYEVARLSIQKLPGLATYLSKIIIPFPQSLFPTLEIYHLVISVLVFILGLNVWSRYQPELNKSQRNLFLFGFVWFITFLFPSSIQTDPTLEHAFLEHRTYLPFIGLGICLSSIMTIKHIKGLVIVTGIFGVLTLNRLHIYQNDLVFWRQAVIESPQLALTHQGLGTTYLRHQQFNQAKQELRLALKINPTFPFIHANLGLIAYRQENYQSALNHFKKELESRQTAQLYYFLGQSYAQINQLNQAQDAWKNALQINPNHQPTLQVVHQNK